MERLNQSSNSSFNDSLVEAPVVHAPEATSPISSTGVPVAPVSDSFNPTKFQKRVRCNGNILKYLGFALIIMGGIQLVFNGIYALCAWDFSWMSFIDQEGTKIEMDFGYSYLFFFALSKSIVALIMMKQGKRIVKLFKPLLKAYTDAENGITQGIAMTKRDSKSMECLRRFIKKATCGVVFITIITCMVASSWMSGLAESYLDQKYDFYVANNMTNYTEFDQAMQMDLPMFQPLDDFQQKPVPRESDSDLMFDPVIEDNFETSEAQKELARFFGRFEGANETMALFHRHHRRFRNRDSDLKTFYDMLKHTRPEYLKAGATYLINTMMFLAGISAFVSIVLFQWFIMMLVNNAQCAQRVLENKYMGPELRRPSTTQAPVIQYIVAPQEDLEARTGTAMLPTNQMA